MTRLALFACAALFAGAAVAAQPVALKPEPVDADGVVTLGDLFDGAGAASATVIAPDPKAGAAVVLDAARVQAAAAFYRSLGRHPVFLRREAVGHIANRLSSALWREAVNMVAEGIADVDQIDAALVHGPGLRWSVVGAHMAYHLGGGAGGIAHYLSHLGPSQERRWQDLGQPRLDAATCAKLVDGIAAEAGGRDIATLEALRDAGLIAVQRALREKRP